MKSEPKVGQVWTVNKLSIEYEILAIHKQSLWVYAGSCRDPRTRHISDLKTMIWDEHGNKPTEDNDDVVFYDVIKNTSGNYGIVTSENLSGGFGTTVENGVLLVQDLLYCKDADDRTCVGFLYESETDGYYHSVDPIICNRAYFSPKPATEAFIKTHIKDAEFKIPIKAVFKRLEAR